jgi:hypothetical protein
VAAALNCPRVVSGLDAHSLDELNNNACVVASSMKGCPTYNDHLQSNLPLDRGAASGMCQNASRQEVGNVSFKGINVTREHRGAFDGASMH